MSEIFLSQADFELALSDVGRKGWYFEQQALSQASCRALLQEVQALKWQYFRDEGEVYQEFQVTTLRDHIVYPPAVSELDSLLGGLVRQYCGRLVELKSWQPTEVAVQRYSTPTAGIGRHRDYSADYGLIVVFTLQGSGKILIYPDRHDGEASHQLETVPGSMMLLAGTGLLGDDAKRPTHSVEPAICRPRTSMAFRMPMASKPAGT